MVNITAFRCVALFCVLLCWSAAHAGTGEKIKCTVVISSKIRPYMEAVGGIRSVLDGVDKIDTDYIFVSDAVRNNRLVYDRVETTGAIIAVGPEALLFLSNMETQGQVHKMYTMVLDPRTRIPQAERLCGIFFSVDPTEQIQIIHKTLPELRVLGILYDPANNFQYIERSLLAASRFGLDLIPIQVTSQNDVPRVLRENWEKIDGLLLIPDATIISSALVKLIIRDGISNGVPVIGYNNFFIRNGALMAFVYDYPQIGKQTGELVKSVLLGGGSCSSRGAGLKIDINFEIAAQMKIKTGGEL